MHPRKTTFCLQPSLITSQEKPFGFNLCVCDCMAWDELQRLRLVLVVDWEIALNTCAREKQWPWGIGLWNLPWYLSCLLAYFICVPNYHVDIFEKLHILWKAVDWSIVCHLCHITECLETNTILNNHCDFVTWGQVNCSFFAWGQEKL